MSVSRPVRDQRGQWHREPALSRRQVGGASAFLLAGWLVGCSPTVDRDPAEVEATSAPPGSRSDAPPGSDPTDLAVLSTTLVTTLDLAQQARTLAEQSADRTAVVAEVSRVLGIQAAVLTRLVNAGSLPDDGSGRSPQSAPPVDDASQTTGPSDAQDLAQALMAHSSRSALGADLSPVSSANIATLMSLHGARRACVELLTQEENSPVLPGPSGAGAITALAGMRQLIYGLEVLAARGAGQDRQAYLQALRRLRAPTRQLTELAGSAAPAAPLGYGLSGPIESVRERRDLARMLVTATTEAVIAGSSARASDTEAIEGTVQLLALIAAIGTEVRVPLSGFPGLRIPAEDS